MREAVQEEVTTTIQQIDITKCKFCDSANINKKGIKKAKKGNLQMFGCKDCGRRFTQNLGFKKKQATLRHREKITRGLKLEDSGIISGLRLYHNFVRPHQGLPDQITPAEAAGIQVEGANKWLTLIQAAAKPAD